MYNQLPQVSGMMSSGVPVFGTQSAFINFMDPAWSVPCAPSVYQQHQVLVTRGGDMAHPVNSTYSTSHEWTAFPPYPGSAQPRAPFYPCGTIQHKLKSKGVATKTIEQVVKGEYILLHEFLPPVGAAHHLAETELKPVLDLDSVVHYRPKYIVANNNKLQNIPNTFLNSVLGATAMKQNAKHCTHCHGCDHVVADCLFSENNPRGHSR